MLRIRITCETPYAEPSYVNQAFVGLTLDPITPIKRRGEVLIPDCHFVLLEDAINAMARHNRPAYEYMCDHWRELLLEAKEFKEFERQVYLPIPFWCSEVIH